MTNADPVSGLFSRLNALGFGSKYLKRMLPEWWTPEAGKSATALLELKILLSRELGLNAAELIDDNKIVHFALPERTKFKRSSRVAAADIRCATSVALAVARTIAAAAVSHYSAPPSDPSKIRADILGKGAKWISFRALLRYAWENGILVVQVKELPEGMPKMDALLSSIDGRPVIVLSRAVAQSAWLAFILAHELGHLASGHIAPDELIIDENLEETAGDDKDERDADRFALTLLGGDPDFRVTIKGTPNAPALAQAAMEKGAALRIDPGHLVLRYAYQSGAWPLAQAALSLLEPESHAPQDIQHALQHYLELGRLPSDTREFLSKVTGLPLA